MKKIITSILIFITIQTKAQVDSANLSITITLPVKAVVLYGNYLSQSPNWGDRKAPDQLLTIIGSGTITVSTTAVTASSKIFLTYATVGGTQGFLSVGTITAGTSFVINSSSGTDTSTVNWWIIN